MEVPVCLESRRYTWGCPEIIPGRSLLVGGVKIDETGGKVARNRSAKCLPMESSGRPRGRSAGVLTRGNMSHKELIGWVKTPAVHFFTTCGSLSPSESAILFVPNEGILGEHW